MYEEVKREHELWMKYIDDHILFKEQNNQFDNTEVISLKVSLGEIDITGNIEYQGDYVELNKCFNERDTHSDCGSTKEALYSHTDQTLNDSQKHLECDFLSENTCQNINTDDHIDVKDTRRTSLEYSEIELLHEKPTSLHN